MLCHLILIALKESRCVRLLYSIHNSFGLFSTHLVVGASISFYLLELWVRWGFLNVHFCTFNKERVILLRIVFFIITIKEVILRLVVRLLAFILLLFLVVLSCCVCVLLDVRSALGLCCRLKVICNTHLFHRNRISF